MPFPIELVTPERRLFSEEIKAVRAPGVDGSFGVLAGHAPLLTELSVGLIKITRLDDTEAFIATSGGFMQVNREKVIVLAETAELSEEIDINRAQAAAARARQLLEVPGSGMDAEEVRKALERAQNRIQIAQIHS